MQKHTHTNTHTHTHTHRDSNEYPIVAFSKNATIINVTFRKLCKKSVILVIFQENDHPDNPEPPEEGELSIKDTELMSGLIETIVILWEAIQPQLQKVGLSHRATEHPSDYNISAVGWFVWRLELLPISNISV